MADSAFKEALRKVKHSFDAQSAKRIIRMFEDKPVNEILKVGFIVQMPEVWHVLEPVYELMCNDQRFEPWLILVPFYDIKSKTFADNVGDYFVKECRNGKMIEAIKDGVWTDVDLESFDYVFLQRPYNEFNPDHLKSDRIARQTRLCYITYATHEIIHDDEYPNDFFEYVYLGFFEDDKLADMLNGRYSSGTHKRYFSVGHPAYENGLKLDKECSYSSVLWAPRWSTDPAVGVSHFMDYYKQLGDFDYGSGKLTVRPHPMMWDNFIKRGVMTAEEKEKILKEWDSCGVITDKNSSILDTFNSTDILISDISSIVPMFFLSGKPIIYCPFDCKYTEVYRNILPGLYMAYDWDELGKALKMLLSGEDPLKAERQRILNGYFLKYNHSSEAIFEQIYKNSTEHKKRGSVT